MRRALKTLRQIRTFAHYHLEVQANPHKNGTKKTMLSFASMGEMDLSYDIFYNFGTVGHTEVYFTFSGTIASLKISLSEVTQPQRPRRA